MKINEVREINTQDLKKEFRDQKKSLMNLKVTSSFFVKYLRKIRVKSLQ